jgi:hypothetical protein
MWPPVTTSSSSPTVNRKIIAALEQRRRGAVPQVFERNDAPPFALRDHN